MLQLSMDRRPVGTISQAVRRQHSPTPPRLKVRAFPTIGSAGGPGILSRCSRVFDIRKSQATRSTEPTATAMKTPANVMSEQNLVEMGRIGSILVRSGQAYLQVRVDALIYVG